MPNVTKRQIFGHVSKVRGGFAKYNTTLCRKYCLPEVNSKFSKVITFILIIIGKQQLCDKQNLSNIIILEKYCQLLTILLINSIVHSVYNKMCLR